MDKKAILGKVFISYSCKDKDFVRKLTDEIQDQGYRVWLDEKELIAGDSLPKTIGKAIETCRVSIIVLSRYSISSNWVQYEVSHATNRMIKGEMRLIPVLIQDVTLPVELSGLVYVDFRESYDDGLRKVLFALDSEASKYDSRRITKEPTFWELIEGILHSAFDSKGGGSMSGEYKSKDFNYVMLGQTAIWYEIISAYGHKRPLSRQWWDEFSEIASDWAVPYILLVTESPVGFEVTESSEDTRGKVMLQDIPSRFTNFGDTKVIIADLSALDNPDDYEAVIENAREIIRALTAVS